MLGLKLLSPIYLAVIECEPTESNEVVKIACAEFTVSVPICVSPSMKITIPEGFFIPCDGVPILAVNVISWPNVDLLVSEVNSVIVSNLDPILDKALLPFKAIESCGLISSALSNAFSASLCLFNATSATPLRSKASESCELMLISV